MTIQRRRDSLFKSSISIRSINDSFQKFSEGIRSARKNSDEIIKSTRESNISRELLFVRIIYFLEEDKRM